MLIVFEMVLESLVPVRGEMGDQPKTVKIGYFETENFQEGTNDSEPKSGMGYEFVQAVANYAGWKCQYVYGSWQEIYQKLLKGEVDVMNDISYTKERSKQMLFTSVPFAQENYYLYVPKNKIKTYETFKSLKGKTVAVTKNIIQTKKLEDWNKKHKAGLVLKYYESSKERIKAYKDKKTDMTLGLSLGVAERGQNILLRYIDSSNAYFPISKKRPDLLEDANQAMATLISTVPRFKSSLEEKYGTDSIMMSELSVKELNWFKKHSTFDVGYLEGSAPFAYTDAHGKAAGTYIDLLKYTFRYYRLDDNKLCYHSYKNVDAMTEDLKRKKIDIFVPCVSNVWRSEKLGFLQSITMTSNGIDLITKKNTAKIHTIAINNLTPVKDANVEKYIKNHKAIKYKDIHECLHAVRSGEADATILNSYQVSIHLHSDGGLVEKRFDEPVDMTLAVASGNNYLLDLVNRGIVNWKQQNISESLVRHTDDMMEISFGDFIQSHYIGALAMIAVLAVAITIPITGWLYTRRRRRIAEKAANIDLLTGLYSRRAYDQDMDRIMQSQDQKKDYAFVVMDANGLKKVNDHLGHRAGDEMLNGLADCIKESIAHFEGIGKAYRTGGDEFVIILEADQTRFASFRHDLLERIEKWHGDLVDHITVSIGYALSSESPNLSVSEIVMQADEQMYQEKNVQKKVDEGDLGRENDAIYERLLDAYNADIDPTTQLSGAHYFYYSQSQIQKEIETSGHRMAIMAITIPSASEGALAAMTSHFIRMFGKENLGRFNDCYYVMTSEAQLEERLKELYRNLSLLLKVAHLNMNVGISIILENDHRSCEEICKKVGELAKAKSDDGLQIAYDQQS